MKHLIFEVKNQTLKRLDSFKPATNSVDYLTATFTFSEDWSGTTKTAKCRTENNAVYTAIIDSKGVCLIPHEVLAQDEKKLAFGCQEFYISVKGVNGSETITTEEIKIEISTTCAGEEINAADPTPELYAQYIAEVEAATKENADTAAEKAENAAESATEAAASAASLKNDYANALKGNASGAVVRLDDVSPVEHFPVVKVHGKNLFNISAITNTDTATNNGDGSITVAANTYYCRLAQTLKEVCPQLKAGDTAVLSFNSTSANTKYMYFHGLQGTWNVGHYITLTEDILNSYVTIYGFADNDTSYGQECVISNIQIEIGKTATEYTPYIDPATITLTSCGKNIHQCKAKTQTINGVTFTVNADGSVTANGTATKATFIGLGSLSVKVGEKYRLSGSPAGSGFDTYLLYIHNNTTGSDIYDLGEGKVFTAKEGDLGLTIAVYADNTVNNLTFKPMVIYGEESGAFEPYNGVTYTPDTEGTVEGLTSIAPTMTLLTDHEGITIDCEYNRDTNEAFANVGGASPETIKAAVNEYLDKHPIEAPVTSVNGKTGSVNLTSADVGALSSEELKTAVDGALKQAKESGEFDGEKGDAGKTAYEYAKDGGYTGTEEEFAAKLAKEKFSNPNALTINDKTYDGTETVDFTDIINNMIDEKLGVIENGAY